MRADTTVRNLKATEQTKPPNWVAEQGGCWEGTGTFSNRLHFPMGHMKLAFSHSERILPKRVAYRTAGP